MVSQFQCRTNVGGSNFPCKKGANLLIYICIYIYCQLKRSCVLTILWQPSWDQLITPHTGYCIYAEHHRSEPAKWFKRENFGTFHEYSKTSNTGSLACTIPFKVASLAKRVNLSTSVVRKSLAKIYPAQISMNWMNTCYKLVTVLWVITISIVKFSYCKVSYL